MKKILTNAFLAFTFFASNAQEINIVEYDLDNMPAEYMINLFRAISKYPQYDYLVDEILAIIISELGETV